MQTSESELPYFAEVKDYLGNVIAELGMTGLLPFSIIFNPVFLLMDQYTLQPAISATPIRHDGIEIKSHSKMNVEIDKITKALSSPSSITIFAKGGATYKSISIAELSKRALLPAVITQEIKIGSELLTSDKWAGKEDGLSNVKVDKFTPTIEIKLMRE